MVAVIVPVLLALLLGPGIGQIYNREYKKGITMFLVGLGILMAFSVWMSKAAIGYIPSGVTKVDIPMMQRIINDHIVKDHAGTFYTYQFLLGGLWIYGIVDAYLGGMRRRRGASDPETSETSSTL